MSGLNYLYIAIYDNVSGDDKWPLNGNYWNGPFLNRIHSNGEEWRSDIGYLNPSTVTYNGVLYNLVDNYDPGGGSPPDNNSNWRMV